MREQPPIPDSESEKASDLTSLRQLYTDAVRELSKTVDAMTPRDAGDRMPIQITGEDTTTELKINPENLAKVKADTERLLAVIADIENQHGISK